MEKWNRSLVVLDQWLSGNTGLSLMDAPFEGKGQMLAAIPDISYRLLVQEINSTNGPIRCRIYSLNDDGATQKKVYVDFKNQETNALQCLQLPNKNEQSTDVYTKFLNELITFIQHDTNEPNNKEQNGGNSMTMGKLTNNFFKKTKVFESNQEQTVANGHDLFAAAQAQQVIKEQVVVNEQVFPSFGQTVAQQQVPVEEPLAPQQIVEEVGEVTFEEDQEKSMLSIILESERRVVEKPEVVDTEDSTLEVAVEEQAEPQLDLGKSILIGMPSGYEELAAAGTTHLQIDFNQLNDELTEVYKFVTGIKERTTLKKLKADLWELELAEGGPTNEQAQSILDDILSLQFTEALLLQWQLKTIRQFYIFMK